MREKRRDKNEKGEGKGGEEKEMVVMIGGREEKRNRREGKGEHEKDDRR